MEEGEQTVPPAVAFVPGTFFRSMSRSDLVLCYLQTPAKVAAAITAFETADIDTVLQAQNLGKEMLIELGISKFGAQYLLTQLGLLRGGMTIGSKRTVSGHDGNLKKKFCIQQTPDSSRVTGAFNTVYLYRTATEQLISVTAVSYVRVSGLSGPNPVSAAVAQSHVSAVVNTAAQLQEFVTGKTEYVERDIPGNKQGPAGVYFIDHTSIVADRIGVTVLSRTAVGPSRLKMDGRLQSLSPI